MKLIDTTVNEFLAAVRSPDPTPGGGSAAALAGAMGASLLAMVAGLPKSRAETDADAARLRAAGERCIALADELTALIDRDSAAYDMVLAAYRKPKGTDGDEAARSAAIQEAMRAAIAAPLDVMRACAAAAQQGVAVGELGLASASSDVQVGVALLDAARRGAQLNVEINLESVKDAGYVATVREEIDRLQGVV